MSPLCLIPADPPSANGWSRVGYVVGLTRLKKGRSWQAIRILPFGDGALTILCVVKLSRPAVRECPCCRSSQWCWSCTKCRCRCTSTVCRTSTDRKRHRQNSDQTRHPVAASHGGSLGPIAPVVPLAAPGTLVPQLRESLRLSEPVTNTQCPGVAGSGTTALQ